MNPPAFHLWIDLGAGPLRWGPGLAVIPILAGPLQVLVTVLPMVGAAVGVLLLKLLRPSTFRTVGRLLRAQRYTLTGVIGVGGLLSWACLMLRAPGGGTESAVEDRDWPEFRGSPVRDGSVPGATGPRHGRVLYRASVGKGAVYCSPAIVGERIYVTTAEASLFADLGSVVCLDAATGEILWNRRPSGYRASVSSPAVKGRCLVFGEGLHFTDSARVICMDVTREGAAVWEYRTNSHVESSPCIADGRVFVGAGDDGLYCFPLEPPPDGSVKPVWHVAGSVLPDVESSPAVVDGRVFVGLGNGGNAVCCLDAVSGTEIWRAPTPYPVFASPTVVGGQVFVGMGTGNLIESAEEARARELEQLRRSGAGEAELAAASARLAPGGAVWCLDAESGVVVWQTAVPRRVPGAVVRLRDGLMAAGSRDGVVRLFDRRGQIVAATDLGAPITAAPATDGERLYLVTADGTLHCLRPESPDPVRRIPLGGKGPYLSAPVLAAGRAYVGTANGTIVCVGDESVTRSTAWRGAFGGPAGGNCVDGSRIPDRGRVAWTFPETAEAPVAGASAGRGVVSAPLAACDDGVLTAWSTGSVHRLLCLAADTDMPRVRWEIPLPLPVVTSPAYDDSVVYAVTGTVGDEGRRLVALAAETGLEQWSFPVESAADGSLLTGRDCVILYGRSGHLLCVNRGGVALWNADFGAGVTGADTCEEIVVVESGGPNRLQALDRRTGGLLWSVSLPDGDAKGLAIRGREILRAGRGRTLVYSLLDGNLLRTVSGGFPVSPLATGDGILVRMDADGGFVWVAEAAGTAVTGPTGGVSAGMPVLSGRRLLWAASRGFLLADAGDPTARPWLRTSRTGNVLFSPILVGSAVYFATDRGSLVCATEGGLP